MEVQRSEEADLDQYQALTGRERDETSSLRGSSKPHAFVRRSAQRNQRRWTEISHMDRRDNMDVNMHID